jgi:hypothetical protein
LEHFRSSSPHKEPEDGNKNERRLMEALWGKAMSQKWAEALYKKKCNFSKPDSHVTETNDCNLQITGATSLTKQLLLLRFSKNRRCSE